MNGLMIVVGLSTQFSNNYSKNTKLFSRALPLNCRHMMCATSFNAKQRDSHTIVDDIYTENNKGNKQFY